MGDTIDHDPLVTRSFSGKARVGAAVVLLACAVLSGCDNGGSIVVTVDHPTNPMLPITSTTIEVYVSSQFTCQDIEYGNVDASALLAAQVAQETIDSTGATMGNLDGLPRVDAKMIVAQGLDDTGSLLAAGCVPVGSVSGTMQVTITTVPAATLSLSLVDTTGSATGSGSGSGSSDPYQLQAIVTAPDGTALTNQVWWRVYGAAGTQPSDTTDLNVTEGVWEPTEPLCPSMGIATIDPVPPSAVGGFEVEVRVAWGVEPPQYFPEFTQIDTSFGGASGVTNSLGGAIVTPPAAAGDHVCTRMVMNSSTGLVCLNGNTGNADFYTVTTGDGTTTLKNTTSFPLAANETPIALYAIDIGSNHEVFAVDSDCSVQGVDGAIAPTYGAMCATGAADDAIVVPACGSGSGASSAKLWIHYHSAVLQRDVIRQVDLAPENPMSPTDFAVADVDGTLGAAMVTTTVSFNSAGCITQLDPTGATQASLLQVGVFNYATVTAIGSASATTNDTRLVNTCTLASHNPCSLDIHQQAALAGTGFVISGTESHLVTTVDNANGVQLAQDVLLKGSNAGLIERSVQPTEAEPSLIVAGIFDAGNAQDLLWTEESKRGTTFQISYPIVVNGEPLSAATQASSVKVLSMEVGSFDGGSNAQIAMYGTGSAGVIHAVAVVPTGVPPEQVAPQPYTGCSP